MSAFSTYHIVNIIAKLRRHLYQVRWCEGAHRKLTGWTGRPSPAAPRGPRGTCSTSWRETRLMLSSPGWVSLSLYQYCHNHIEGASLTLLRFRPSTERGTESNQHYSNVSPMSPLLTLDQSPMFGVCVAPGRGGRIFI